MKSRVVDMKEAFNINMENVVVIGAGLAGCEAAWAIANECIKVTLYDMKPDKKSPAHRKDGICELVCSNSLKADRPESAAGLLKMEMEVLGSLLVPCARKTAVAAGGALAVDRNLFSAEVENKIRNHENINFVENSEITEIPEGNVIIATGPLTSDGLSEKIEKISSGRLSFFDAAAPVVSYESIDQTKVFAASRYGRGEADYINCPMEKDEYLNFYNELISAEKAPLKEIDKQSFRVYEGCMPIEVLASRGVDTMRFGPLKPVGLTNPHTGKRPYAVIQLRRENSEGTMWNLVGFQTNLKFGEQKRVFSLIPGLENADFVRYGVMHRNFFINSPKLLDADYSLRENKNIYFAGQMTGVEGYMESAASGLLAGINMARKIKGKTPYILPVDTMTGALANYISSSESADFQPMGANMGILPSLPERIKDKKMKYAAYTERAMDSLRKYLEENK